MGEVELDPVVVRETGLPGGFRRESDRGRVEVEIETQDSPQSRTGSQESMPVGGKAVARSPLPLGLRERRQDAVQIDGRKGDPPDVDLVVPEAGSAPRCLPVCDRIPPADSTDR